MEATFLVIDLNMDYRVQNEQPYPPPVEKFVVQMLVLVGTIRTLRTFAPIDMGFTARGGSKYRYIDTCRMCLLPEQQSNFRFPD